MKILVPTKRVVDTDQRIEVRDDGLGIADDQLPFVVNPFDAIALEEALRLQEDAAESIEITTVGIGPSPYEQELRTGLAMGADRAIWVETSQSLDPWNIANILKVVVQKESPQLVMMGKQAVDDDSNQVGQFLAALLGWPQATFVSRVEISDRTLLVSRETDIGIERIRVAFPAVVTTDLRLNEPRYASLPSILKAKKKSIENWPISDLMTEHKPTIEITKMTATSAGRNCVQLGSVEDLVDQLANGRKSP